jgi:hypothetical protein
LISPASGEATAKQKQRMGAFWLDATRLCTSFGGM